MCTKLSMDWETPISGFRSARFERIEPAKNAYRFYQINWQPTLFEEWAVVRIYGRKGQPKRMIATSYASLEEAWPFIRKLVKIRLRHGYRVIQVNTISS